MLYFLTTCLLLKFSERYYSIKRDDLRLNRCCCHQLENGAQNSCRRTNKRGWPGRNYMVETGAIEQFGSVSIAVKCCYRCVRRRRAVMNETVARFRRCYSFLREKGERNNAVRLLACHYRLSGTPRAVQQINSRQPSRYHPSKGVASISLGDEYGGLESHKIRPSRYPR